MRIITGKYGRRRFDVPTNITARPTTDFARENIFNVMGNMIDFDEVDALDLFAGTGAISFELASRGCRSVTSVEQSAIQSRFIGKVKDMLGASEVRLIRGDVFKFLNAKSVAGYDLIFADPPYELPNFDDVPKLVLERGLLRPGGIFVLEHNKHHDYSGWPGFVEHRAYGSVNFSIFKTAPSGE